MKAKKLPVLLPLQVLVFSVSAQTGPAGVGTSATNVSWFKADAGTSTTVDGATVSAWNDQSGNGVNLTQTLSSEMPTYKASLMNGMPAVEFDNNTTDNDYLSAPDNTILDNTTGYTIFTVTRMKNLNGDARCIIAKRTTVDVDEAFMLFYYTGNNVYLDIDGTANRFSTSPTAYVINTNYIFNGWYDGTLAAANRSRLYEGETLRKTANENSAIVDDKPSPLIMGATHTADNRPFGGFVAEAIVYRTALNDASRIIVNNYLSAKYNIALAANDRYAGDNTGNGDFDREVAGVGRESSGSNVSFSPSVCAGLGMTTTGGLNDGDYVLAGHRLVTNVNSNVDISVVSGGPLDMRWQRVWYIDVTNTGAAVSANVVIDLSDGGFPGLTAGPASNYKLLYRATNTGAWTIVATASSVAGDQVTFGGYSFASNSNDGYYTIGTLNNSLSPLPVELLDFHAVLNGDRVDLDWTTASETNNAYFTVERSKEGTTWAEVLRVNGAGNSNNTIHYMDIDPTPLPGVSYYRLKQTDTDGSETWSDVVVVKNNNGTVQQVNVYPNPSDGMNLNLSFSGFGDEDVLVVIRDIQGREYYSRIHAVKDSEQIVAIDLDSRLSAGTYLVVASSEETLVSRKVVVKK